MRAIENHMVIRDQDYYNEMSGISWAEETEPCPMCQGDKYVAHRCTCGVMPTIDEDECSLCGKTIHWKTCPLCQGAGETPVRS